MARERPRVLLINADACLDRTSGHFGRLIAPMHPLGLAYLASALERAQISVAAFDAALEGGTSALLERLRSFNPDIVGLSMTTPLADEVTRLARLARRVLPDAAVVLGNIHAELFASELLSAGVADVVVRGEGEETLVELAFAMRDRDLDRVRGICFLKDGVAISTPDRAPPQDLDRLPFPAWHLFPFHRYRLFSYLRLRERAALVLGSRGCPYRCSFCAVRPHGGRRARSAQNIVDEIEWLHRQYGVEQVMMIDPIFPLTREEGERFAEEMCKRGLHRKVVWACDTRPDLADTHLLRVLKEAGLRRVMLGFESADDSLLRGARKGFRSGIAAKAALAAREAGVESVGFFILGLPGSTPESVEATIRMALDLPLTFAKFSIFSPLPGTAIYRELLEAGKIKTPRNWLGYTHYPTRSNPPNYVAEGLTPEYLIRAQRNAFIRFYGRPHTIFLHLFKVRTLGIKEMALGAFTVLLSLLDEL